MAYQRRWLAYCRALDIRPEDGVAHRFVAWMCLRISEWSKITGVDVVNRSMSVSHHREFDRWLKGRAEYLRSLGPLYHHAEAACHVLRKKDKLREWAGFTADDGFKFHHDLRKAMRARGELAGSDGVRFQAEWSDEPNRLVWIHPKTRTILTYNSGVVTLSKVSARSWNSVIDYLENFYRETQ